MAMYEISIKIEFLNYMFYNRDLGEPLAPKGELSYFCFDLTCLGDIIDLTNLIPL